MKGTWIALTGIVTAFAYGAVSRAMTGAWNFSLAFVPGAIVALALSGFRLRKVKKPTGNSAHSASNPKPSASRLPPGSPTPARHPDTPTPRLPPDTPTPILPPDTPTPAPRSAMPPSDGTAEALWKRACEMEPDLDRKLPVEDCGKYMELLFGAAEGGCVPALARLGALAFRRAAFVEAYFWTKLAHRRLELSDDPDPQGLRKIGDMLRNIRREWLANGHPPEFGNVYGCFPEERGELGRAFLRLDSGMEVGPTRAYIRFLAGKGNPDAALFACRRA